MNLHRLAVVPSGHQGNRRQESAHALEVRLPLDDPRFEERADDRIVAYCRIEAPDETIDHRLVDSGRIRNCLRDQGSPRISDRASFRHSVTSHPR